MSFPSMSLAELLTNIRTAHRPLIYFISLVVPMSFLVTTRVFRPEDHLLNGFRDFFCKAVSEDPASDI